jgi:hypothetical protein
LRADETVMPDRMPAPVPLWLQDQHDAADARASRWRLVGFGVAAAVWAFPSLFVWFFLVVGFGGWSGENGATEGAVSGGADGVIALAWGVLIEVGAAGALMATARWAIGPTRVAIGMGLASTVWLQLLVSLVVCI